MKSKRTGISDKPENDIESTEYRTEASEAKQFINKTYQNYSVDGYMKSRGLKDIE